MRISGKQRKTSGKWIKRVKGQCGEKKRRLGEGLGGRIVEGSIDNLFIEE